MPVLRPMIPVLLVIGYVTGIAISDRGLSIWPAMATGWLVFGLGLILWIVRAFATRSPTKRETGASEGDGARPRINEWPRGLVVASLVGAVGLSFFAGFERLEGQLAAAERSVERADPGIVFQPSIRLAEGRVRARRSGRFGEEIELESVRAVDGGRPLPRRLDLRLSQDIAIGAVGADRQTSRAQRLLWPGAWVRMGLRVKPFLPSRNPGSSDRERQLARRGRGAVARLVKPDWVMSISAAARPEWNRSAAVARARASLRQRVALKLSELEAGSGLVRALALGDRDGIRPETRMAFRRVGLSHLLAVSGLHVGFVAGFVGWIVLRTSGWLLPIRRSHSIFDWTLGIACLAAAAYAWLTNAGVSVERAALLFGLFALFRLSLRRVSAIAALSWVFLAILVMDPSSLFDVGAQLSFGACLSLILAGFWQGEGASRPNVGIESGVISRIQAAAIETSRASLAISLGTAPLLVQHGIPMAVLSPLFNVVAIPWTGLLVLPGSLVAVLAAEILPDIVLEALVLPARIMETVVVGVAGLLPDPSIQARLGGWMVLGFVGWAFLLIRRGAWRPAAALWIVISLAGGIPTLSGSMRFSAPEVVFFDVGQGDAMVVQGRDAVVLVDTGGGPPDGSGGQALVRGLRAIGVHNLDVLVVTHADLDHRGGAALVLRKFSVGELWLPVTGRAEASLLALSTQAEMRGTRVRWLAASSRDWLRGDVAIKVLSPVLRASGIAPSRNEGSLVLRVVVDGMVLLLTADIGAEVEKGLLADSGALNADILKVAHHGSAWSSTAPFLRAVGATVAVVSAPCDTSRGLPNGDALRRVHEAGSQLFWTGREGAVVVRRDASSHIVAQGWATSRDCQPK